MASKAELTEQARALATELGKAVETEGLSHQALGALLESLEAEKAAAQPPPAAAGEAPAAESAVETFVVAPGLSLGCRRGHLNAGEPVTAADFGVGKAGLDEFESLRARGVIVAS